MLKVHPHRTTSSFDVFLITDVVVKGEWSFLQLKMHSVDSVDSTESDKSPKHELELMIFSAACVSVARW